MWFHHRALCLSLLPYGAPRLERTCGTTDQSWQSIRCLGTLKPATRPSLHARGTSSRHPSRWRRCGSTRHVCRNTQLVGAEAGRQLKNRGFPQGILVLLT